jgi:hypothetical protein
MVAGIDAQVGHHEYSKRTNSSTNGERATIAVEQYFHELAQRSEGLA